jgi:hypothetical protein
MLGTWSFLPKSLVPFPIKAPSWLDLGSAISKRCDALSFLAFTVE